MYKLKIVDSFFSHIHCLGNMHQLDQNIIWDRNVSMMDEVVFYTSNFSNPAIGKTKIALLIESPYVTKNLYDEIQQYENNFNYILTFDTDLLSRGEKYLQYFLGGCWMSKENIKIFNKHKNISIIASNKKHLEGHDLRHKIVSKYRNKIDFICGRGYLPINEKIEALKDFRYSISIENCKKDTYFTEKIIDCFATATIPIYWGCDSIHKYFNNNGFYTFSSIEELNNILNIISENDYNSKLEYIKENFELSKKYLTPENNILDVILSKINLDQYKIVSN